MKRTALVGLLALVSLAAQGAENVPGWRVGGAASFADFQGNDKINPSLGNNFIDDSSVGLKAWGQYRFNEWFAVEAAYHNTGSFEDLSTSDAADGTVKLSFDGFSAQGLLFIPFEAEEIQPYVKAGIYSFDDELSLNGSVTSNSSESSFVIGGGAVIDIGSNFSIRADGEWFDADVGDLWAVNLGLEYSFGGSGQGAAIAADDPPPPAPVAEPAAAAAPEAEPAAAAPEAAEAEAAADAEPAE